MRGCSSSAAVNWIYTPDKNEIARFPTHAGSLKTGFQPRLRPACYVEGAFLVLFQMVTGC